MEKTKKEIVIIGLILLMVIALIGVSWAVFNYSALGTKVNTITTGSITMSYEESDNTISLNGALPTTDKTGMVRLNPGEYCVFTVSSQISGDVNINYEISAKDVTSSDVKKIDGSNIKLYLTRLTSDGTEEQVMSPRVYTEESTSNNFTGRPANEMSLYTSSMSSSESNKYRLRMYVDEEYNPQGDGGNLTFSVKINVYGRDRVAEEASTVLLDNIPKENQYDDGVDIFITGEDPNNYIWYSGKLWRAVSVANEAKTTKLVTQWNISAITYSSSSTDFAGSYMEDWLNDTSADGFLGNLRDYENFIVTDAKWNATLDATSLGSITRPSDSGTIVTDAVGLLNMYEYQSSYHGTTYSNGYLNNGLYWWTLTPYNSSSVWCVNYYGRATYYSPSSNSAGVRPSINLKSSVRIVDGDGTIDNPYRLNGDNDTNLSGTVLSSRYSGEYIKFGNDENNNLYRIVSHENGTGTKITSAEPLKSTGTFITMNFGSNATFSSTNTIGTFLNGEYLTNYVDSTYIDMIEDSTTWYLGTVGSGASYKLAKYTDTAMSSLTSSTTNAKVGLLRYGELMAGQFEKYYANVSATGLTTNYWTLTPYSSFLVRYVGSTGDANYYSSSSLSVGVWPSVNLKSNVQIINGDGTLNSPFEIQLGS